MFLRIALSCDRYLTVLSVYALTHTSPEEYIMAFYQDLRTAVTKVPQTDKIHLLDDFYARVGKITGLGRHFESMTLEKLNNNEPQLLSWSQNGVRNRGSD